LPNKVAVDQQAKDMIIELGLLIRDCRGTLSQSQLAKRVSLPRSNMKYIEDGVNAPTAEVYDKLIKELKPDLQTRQRMDRLYMAIRKVPPPDICRTITQNKDLVDAMRKLDGCNLTPDQIKSVTTLFASFQENREGEPIK
jgi:DNA-binding XRE family transcriptional regulator